MCAIKFYGITKRFRTRFFHCTKNMIRIRIFALRLLDVSRVSLQILVISVLLDQYTKLALKIDNLKGRSKEPLRRGTQKEQPLWSNMQFISHHKNIICTTRPCFLIQLIYYFLVTGKYIYHLILSSYLCRLLAEFVYRFHFIFKTVTTSFLNVIIKCLEL